MRVLKDGTIKYKKSALAAAEWMQQAPLPMRSFRKGTFVKVFMGAGWQAGGVVQSSRDRCEVTLRQGNKTVIVFDRRNIKTS